jgi:hypothetical protein
MGIQIRWRVLQLGKNGLFWTIVLAVTLGLQACGICFHGLFCGILVRACCFDTAEMVSRKTRTSNLTRIDQVLGKC